MKDLSWRYSAVGQEIYSSTTERRPSPRLFGYFGPAAADPKARRKWVLATLAWGLSAISLGSLILGVDPYKLMFKMKVTFSDGGETFLMWRKPDVELYLKVTLFNVTNAEAYMAGKESKLRFNEVGPYVYREYLEHDNVTFNENGTMTANPKHPLHFEPEKSGGKEDDMLILPNIALLSMAQVVSKKSIFTRAGVNLLIMQTKTRPLVPMTAKEFMFGYRSTLLTLGHKFLPSWIRFDKLGLIDRMYDFDGDTSTTFTGETDIRLSGLIDNYNGRPTLPQWKAPCNRIDGASDGSKFNSLIAPNETLRFFRKSLCRSIELVRTGEATVSGLAGYTYALKNNSLDNGIHDPDNRCFCRDVCLKEGLLDVSQCYFGFPIALSFPHFLDADPSLVAAVEGMKPDKKKHGTYFVINQEAGLPLELSVKMQINMALGDITSISNAGKFSNLILPMLWMDIEMPGLSTGMLTKFYIYLNIGPAIQAVLTYLFLICGIAFVLLALASSILIPRLSFVSDGNVFSQPTPVPQIQQWKSHQVS